MERVYSRHVGEKFNEDGSARLFPGNTVLCPVTPASDTMEILKQFHAAILQELWHRYYAMLPPSSFHMTVFDLVCDQVRKPENWTTLLPLDAPLEAVDAFVQQQWQSAPSAPQPSVVVGRLEIGDYITLRLRPLNDPANQLLRQYRDTLSAVFGIRQPNHTEYFFHLTYAYGITALDEREKEIIADFVQHWEPLLQQQLAVLELLPPQLCFFQDMTHFAATRASAQQKVQN